jgi:osmotically inducible protein OsmC
MAKIESHGHVDWQGDLQKGGGELDVGSGALGTQNVTFGARTGKVEARTNPEELIAAAHATCFAMAFSNTLAQAGNPPERLDVNATVTLDTAALKVASSHLEVRGQVPGLDQAGFEQAAEEAEQKCPVSNALRGNVDISLSATLA